MATAPQAPDAKQPVVIKKYANRRLYNTETSAYITLDHLAEMTRGGRDFQVFDARTGEDITHSVLTQIVMDGENGKDNMLPVSFLRQIISMYGDQMQSMVPAYLEASMDAFAKNQAQFRDAALKPFEHLAKQNLAMFEAAATMFAGAKPATRADEVSALQAEVAALKAKLEAK